MVDWSEPRKPTVRSEWSNHSETGASDLRSSALSQGLEAAHRSAELHHSGLHCDLDGESWKVFSIQSSLSPKAFDNL